MSRTKYEGYCYQCGLIVKPNTGHFERYNGNWRVKHANVPGDGRITCEAAKKLDEQTQYVHEMLSKISYPY